MESFAGIREPLPEGRPFRSLKVMLDARLHVALHGDRFLKGRRIAESLTLALEDYYGMERGSMSVYHHNMRRRRKS